MDIQKLQLIRLFQKKHQDANCIPINHPVFMAYVRRKLKSPYEYIMMQVRDITR